jgi:vacuolar-type H+-ATPase subunit I/STV1
VNPPTKPQTNDSSNVSLLLLHIKNLEDKLEEIKSKEPLALDSKVDSSKIEELNAKIKDLEEKIQNKEKTPNEDILIKAIQSLEQKINTNNQASELINKLEGLIGKASLGIVSQEVKEENVFRPEEIYVPNIQVEDGNSHIKLKVRTIEQSSDINDAAAALKNIKSKSK